MSTSDDRKLKSFLKQNEPLPPQQSKAESDSVMLAIEQEISISNPPKFRNWLGAGSFVAATFIAAIVTLKTVSLSNQDSQTLVAPTEVALMQVDGQDFAEDEAPELEIGQDWLDLVAAY